MMKTIDKMTDQEIYDLTDEQVEKLIVIRCAEEVSGLWMSLQL